MTECNRCRYDKDFDTLTDEHLCPECISKIQQGIIIMSRIPT